VTISVASSFDSNPSNDGCTGGGCAIQTQIGLNTDAVPQACPTSGGVGTTTSGTVTINVPNVPGRYYVGMDRSLDYGCFQSKPQPVSPPNDQRWWSGPPDASRYIGIVDVVVFPAS
jgi:hypothetical protein